MEERRTRRREASHRRGPRPRNDRHREVLACLTIRVLIVDDHPARPPGPAFVPRRRSKGSKSSARRPTARKPSRLVGELAPDVVLMDLAMPNVDGIEATRRITESSPDAKVIALTSFATDDKVFPAIRAGAAGYLLKEAEPAEIADAIAKVAPRRADPASADRRASDARGRRGDAARAPHRPDRARARGAATDRRRTFEPRDRARARRRREDREDARVERAVEARRRRPDAGRALRGRARTRASRA